MSTWPHAPAHHFAYGNTFFITGATYAKQHFYREPAALDELQQLLFAKANEYDCWLQAWCLLSNHYHLVIRADGPNVKRMLARLHSKAAIELNRRDCVKGRQVWYQYWDKTLTFESSWLARLKYTMENAVHHGIVHSATQYPWCSSGWFAKTASPAFLRTVQQMKIDAIRVYDEFECGSVAAATRAAAMPPHS